MYSILLKFVSSFALALVQPWTEGGRRRPATFRTRRGVYDPPNGSVAVEAGVASLRNPKLIARSARAPVGRSKRPGTGSHTREGARYSRVREYTARTGWPAPSTRSGCVSSDRKHNWIFGPQSRPEPRHGAPFGHTSFLEKTRSAEGRTASCEPATPRSGAAASTRALALGGEATKPPVLRTLVRSTTESTIGCVATCTRVLAHWCAQRAHPARTLSNADAAWFGLHTCVQAQRRTRLTESKIASPALGLRPSLLPTVYTPTS